MLLNELRNRLAPDHASNLPARPVTPPLKPVEEKGNSDPVSSSTPPKDKSDGNDTGSGITEAGKGAKELINGQLVAEAKRSLQFSSRPVKEIAYQLHFSTPEQCSHFFKKNAMMSPQDYRARFVNFGR